MRSSYRKVSKYFSRISLLMLPKSYQVVAIGFKQLPLKIALLLKTWDWDFSVKDELECRKCERSVECEVAQSRIT